MCAAVAITSVTASAQSITVETDVTGGVSTENVRAGSAQARIFGATASDWRFFSELSLGGSTGQPSDAFNAAYPYDRRLRPMELYVEKTLRPGRYIAGGRGGRHRTPVRSYTRGD